MSLPFPFRIEKVLESYPVESIKALFPPPLLFLSLPFSISLITCLPSIYHVLCTRYIIGLEIQGKPDIFSHPRSFYKRGDKTLLPFICWLSFWWESAMSQGVHQQMTYRQMSLSARAILKCLEIHLQVIMKRAMSRYKEETIFYFLGCICRGTVLHTVMATVYPISYNPSLPR